MNNKTTRELVEAGISLALAIILNFIVLFRMPLGGSVTLASRLPLVIYSIRWGVKKGIIVSALFGLLQIFLGGYVIHPIQGLMDYFLSYGAMGLAGLGFTKNRSKSKLVLSIIISYIISGAFNVVSGLVYFYDTATSTAAGFNSFLIYSLSYNYSFLFFDALILIVVLLVTFDRLKGLYKYQG